MDWKRDFDWDGAIKRHSEALKGIVAALFAMLGMRDGDSLADSASPPPRRAAGAQARRIRHAAPHCRCGPGSGGEGGAVASHAQGAEDRKGQRAFPSLLQALR